jgi:hypothetical protein
MDVVERWEQVPAFATEAEEAAYWDTHELGDEILSQMGPMDEDVLPPARPRTRPLAIRFDEDVIRRPGT